ncbi:hypothetical protein PYW08_006228 [Mythimna loreyi]|uniref:Uncharacterized protein n=1 Tax=Mythimna loreyi TaxID=667449 RepID=A0ACC2QM28_9NEOP|nr:hypothetical protein PYW08_006228 [Mythimna loreyi]
MNQVDQNINKDMFDSDLIDVESLDYSDDQTWLYKVPHDSGQDVDIVDWNLSCDWPIKEDSDYLKLEKTLYTVLDEILKNEILSMPDKHKFDSRTYVKPKKRVHRPSIQNIVEAASNPPSMSPIPSLSTIHQSPNILSNMANISSNQSANKYLTYNKYNNPLGAISPMLRLKTFNVDVNSENSHAVKEYAMKRRSLVQDDDPQLEDLDLTLASEVSGRSSMDHPPSKPINIDLSQPAHNLHNTFNKGMSNLMNERPSLNMYQSGESLMRMSPPSLVSSLLMESSGTFNAESIESSRKSMPSHKDSGLPMSGRDSIDPMMTSMTLSILDEKDMSTSFLSQTTYPDNDSLMDSLPPSLVSSVNSSYVISNTSKQPKESTDSNIFSSATFTHLEASEKLLSARPRCQLYNSYTKRESGIRNSESYTKSREEACQIDTAKILNENSDKKDSPKNVNRNVPTTEMAEPITLHYSNNRFSRRDNDAEKENFETDDAFYKDMGLPKPEDVGRNSLNVTLGKQELNEIIQARQKLSLARKALPTEPEKSIPASADTSPIKTIQLPNQTVITVPRQSMENASELLSRRRVLNGNGFDRPEEPVVRDTPKRNATFKKLSPKASAMDTTVVYMKGDDNQIIDINSATLNLIDVGDRTLQQEHRDWGSQERAMVGSSESTDTGTFSSSSPPDSVPDTQPTHDPRPQVASTPLMSLRKGAKTDLLNLHNTISPIYDMIDDKSYTVTTITKANSSGMERTYDMHNTTVINSATMVKKSSVKRDIMAGKVSPEKKMFAPSVMPKPTRIIPTSSGAAYSNMVPPAAVPRKTSLPTSKLRQYSSHRELSRIPGGPSAAAGVAVAARGLSLGGRSMVRRGVYASNPALSPTASAPPVPPVSTESYIITVGHQKIEDKPSKPDIPPTPALVRQGTETLRRERPQSQLVAPRDLRAGAGSGVPVSMRSHHLPPPTTRPYSIAAPSQIQRNNTITRPASGPVQCKTQPPVIEQPRPASSNEARVSALPRPSRLPAPRRALRPPSVYSVAPTADIDHY